MDISTESNQHIVQAITKEVIVNAVSSVKTLPTPPKIYMQLNELLKQKNVDSQRIANIITQDPALAAKVLQFSNTSFLVSGKKLTNINDAITKMGIDTLCCIVMTSELFSYTPNIENFSVIDEQLHCLATAKLTASLVKPELKQDAMIAGLLHDIGKVVLYEINPPLTRLYFSQRSKGEDNILFEQKIFGTDHCHIGGYLLHLWKFPAHIIESTVLHHSPQKLLRSTFGIAQAVYLATTLLDKFSVSPEFIKHYQLENTLDKLRQKLT